MGRIRGVPGGPEKGSPGPDRVLGVLGAALVALLGGASTAGGLEGDAQPIVRLGGDGAAPLEAGTSSCDPGAPIALFYRTAQAASDANSIDFLFKVVNKTGAALPLGSLAVRYYFTNELTPSWQTSVYYA